MTPALHVLGRAVVAPPAPDARARVTAVATAVLGDAARAGLRHILAAPDVAVTDLAPTGDDVLAAVRWQPPHVLLLDGRLSHPDALEVTARLAAEAPHTRTLLFLATDAAELPLRAVELGAAGHVDARADADALRAAVRAARAGERVLSPVMREALLAQPSAAASPDRPLTAREFQVLRLVGQGASVADIEAALSISRSTVHTFKSQIRDKLGLSGDVALAHYAAHHGIV